MSFNSKTVPEPIRRRPRIGITLGDPAGIGPEVVVKAISEASVNDSADIVLIGSPNALHSVGANRELVDHPTNGFEINGRSFTVVDPTDPQDQVTIGVESVEGGRAAAACILRSVELWRRGAIDAVCTAPISKHALALAGFPYPGHTEFLAELTHTKRFAMSFFADRLRVVLLSTHCSLADAISKVTTEALVQLIRFSDEELKRLLGREIKIAVAGLNPHASEGSMFGTEEAEQISPAISTCREKFNIDVAGPFSPDTIFLRGFRGEFDVVIACYHDQATIAVKSLSFGSAVNVTLGLPLIRTSVDHGTAFDIAGKNRADASSMKAAISTAVELVNIAHSGANTQFSVR